MAETLEIVIKEGASPSPTSYTPPPVPPTHNLPAAPRAPVYTQPPPGTHDLHETKSGAFLNPDGSVHTPAPPAPPAPVYAAPPAPPAPVYAPPPKPQEPFGLNHVSQLLGAAGQGTAAKLTGAAGEAAAGAEAGGIAGVMGPAGLIIGAVLAIKGIAKEAIQTTSSAAQSVARLDGAGLVETFENTARAVPFFGDMLADASKGLRDLTSAVSDTSRRLSEYNGQLALANAKADVAQIVGDIRRSQMLSSGLSRFTDLTSNISQNSQDVMAKTLLLMLPTINKILEWVSQIAELANAGFVEVEIANAYLEGLVIFIQTWNPKIASEAVAVLLQQIKDNTTKAPEGSMTNFLDDIGKAVNAFALQPQPQQFGQNLIPPNPFAG